MPERKDKNRELGKLLGRHLADWSLVVICVVLWNRWGEAPVIVLLLTRLVLGALVFGYRGGKAADA
jgi:hypothetical protein